MRKFVKILIGIGMLALIAGGIIIGLAIKTNAFVKEETVIKETVLEGDFDDIFIDLDVSDLTFVYAPDGVSKVVSVEREKRYNEVKIENNKLVITTIDTHHWYESMFDFNWDKQSVTVYLTKNVFNALSIKDSTGNIELNNSFTFETATVDSSTGNINFDSKVNKSLNVSSSTGYIAISNQELSNDLIVKASTGDINLKNIKSSTLNVDVDNGKVYLSDVVVNDLLKIKTSTGDVRCVDFDGGMIDIKTSTGDVYLEVLTAKTFKATTSTGDVNVPQTTGPECIIKTSTGNITAKIK